MDLLRRLHMPCKLKYKLQIRIGISTSHSILIPGQPVQALTLLYHQAPGRAATGVPMLKLPKHLFVPTSLCAHVSLCPRLFVPMSLYAQKSGILCPRLFVPKKVVFCAHVSLCPRLFVPTSLYAQTYASGSCG